MLTSLFVCLLTSSVCVPSKRASQIDRRKICVSWDRNVAICLVDLVTRSSQALEQHELFLKESEDYNVKERARLEGLEASVKQREEALSEQQRQLVWLVPIIWAKHPQEGY